MSLLRIKAHRSGVLFYHRRSFNRKYTFNSATSDIAPLARTNYIKSKFNELVAWYEEVTGMDEVRIMQNKVIEAQDKFVLAQEKRREMAKELSRVQNQLKEIYSELDTTSRGEERFS